MSATIQVAGVKEAIRSLNKIEPGLRKKFTAEANAIGEPAIKEAQKVYAVAPWGETQTRGVDRKWAGPAVRGRQAFPWNRSKAMRGVKVKLNSDRKTVASILIEQSDLGTAIIETAGRKTSNPLGNALEPLGRRRSRILGPSVFRRKKEIEGQMEKFALEVFRKVNRELQ